jgi:hypothetical protein
MMVTLHNFDLGFTESFLGKMLPDGRVTVPRILIVTLLQRTSDLKANFFEVSLDPA